MRLLSMVIKRLMLKRKMVNFVTCITCCVYTTLEGVQDSDLRATYRAKKIYHKHKDEWSLR